MRYTTSPRKYNYHGGLMSRKYPTVTFRFALSLAAVFRGETIAA